MSIDINKLEEARGLVELLGDIARVAYFRADDTCEHVSEGLFTVPKEDCEAIQKALVACDHLPEPEDGYVSDGWNRALRRLRQLLSEFEASYPTPEAYEAACSALRKHRERADQAEQREQALAAHVERLRSYLGVCRHLACYSIGEPEALAMQMATIRKVADQGLRGDTETSLARRDARMKAEILEVAKSKIIEDPHGDPVAKLEYMAYRMRRQAEEDQQ